MPTLLVGIDEAVSPVSGKESSRQFADKGCATLAIRGNEVLGSSVPYGQPQREIVC